MNIEFSDSSGYPALSCAKIPMENDSLIYPSSNTLVSNQASNSVSSLQEDPGDHIQMAGGTESGHHWTGRFPGLRHKAKDPERCETQAGQRVEEKRSLHRKGQMELGSMKAGGENHLEQG